MSSFNIRINSIISSSQKRTVREEHSAPLIYQIQVRHQCVCVCNGKVQVYSSYSSNRPRHSLEGDRLVAHTYLRIRECVLFSSIQRSCSYMTTVAPGLLEELRDQSRTISVKARVYLHTNKQTHAGIYKVSQLSRMHS